MDARRRCITKFVAKLSSCPRTHARSVMPSACPACRYCAALLNFNAPAILGVHDTCKVSSAIVRIIHVHACIIVLIREYSPTAGCNKIGLHAEERLTA